VFALKTKFTQKIFMTGGGRPPRSPASYAYACNPTFLTGQVYPMPMSSVPHAWRALDRKITLFKLIANFFLKGVTSMFWHDIVYIEIRHFVTNFELVWN